MKNYTRYLVNSFPKVFSKRNATHFKAEKSANAYCNRPTNFMASPASGILLRAASDGSGARE
jgi:hypothetical protein